MIKRKAKLKPADYLKKVFAQRRAIQGAQQTLIQLENQWIKENCPIEVGTVVKIDKTEAGHTEFLVSKIHVDVEQATGEGGKEIGGQFSIQFSFTGLFQGDDVEPLKGRTRFNVKDISQKD